MKYLNFFVTCSLMIGSVGFAHTTFRHLDCEPPGYDGTPAIKALVQYDSVLQNVTSQYIFEQGAMEPSHLGSLTALPQNDSYNTQAFVLLDSSKPQSSELLILPRYLTSVASGVSFNAIYEQRGLLNRKKSIEHRTLKCTLK